MPTGFKVAAGYVEVSPDTTGFAEKLDAQLSGADKQLKIPAVLDSERVEADAEKIRAQIESYPPAKIRAEVDQSSLNQLKTDTQKASQDAGQGGGSLMAAGIAAAVALGGPLVAGAMVGAADLGIVAMAAKLDSSAPQFKAAWTQLANDASSNAHVWADQLVTPMTQALNTLDNDLIRQSPLISDMFRQAGSSIPFLTLGVEGLVDSALPGLDNAMSHSGVVAQGFENLLQGLGSGLGHIGDEVAQSANTISVDLTQVGNTGREFGNVLGDVIHTTGNLADGALPLLNGAVNVVDMGLRGLNAVAGPLEQGLGTLGAGAGLAFGAFKLGQPIVKAISDAVQNAGKWTDSAANSMLNLAVKLENASPKLSNFALNVGKEIESMGPAGLAGVGMAGVAVIDALAQADQAAAARAQQHAQAVSSLTQALASNNGQINQNVSQTLEQQLQTTKLSENTQNLILNNTSLANAFQQVGIGQSQAVSAIEQGGPAYSALTQHLKDIQGGADGATKDQSAMAMAALSVLPQVSSAYGDAKNQANQLGQATKTTAGNTSSLVESMVNLSAKSDITNSGLHTLSSDLNDAANKANNLTTFLNAVETHLAEMADHGLEKANDATSAFYQGLQQMVSTLQSATGPILTTNGDLDLTSQRGQAVLTAIEGARNSMTEYAGAMQNANQPQAAINAGLNTMENNLIGTLEKMGLSANAAHTLAASYLAIPTSITTNVNAVTAPAQAAINAFVANNNGRQIDVFVNTQTGAVRAAGTKAVAQAEGSIVMPMAAGGVATPAAPIAQVVQPGTLKLIGDNPTYPEAFIPVDPNSQRSQAILAATNQIMGQGGAAGTVNHYTQQFNITSTDPVMVAQELMSLQQWVTMSARAS